MFYTFEVKYGDDDWRPITLANIHQVMGFLGRETTIRRFKGWGE